MIPCKYQKILRNLINFVSIVNINYITVHKSRKGILSMFLELSRLKYAELIMLEYKINTT